MPRPTSRLVYMLCLVALLAVVLPPAVLSRVSEGSRRAAGLYLPFAARDYTPEYVDRTPPEIRVVLYRDGQPCAPKEEGASYRFVEPHLHGLPTGYYALEIASVEDDESGVGSVGFDLFDDGNDRIDVADTRYLLDPSFAGIQSFKAVAYDLRDNRAVVPIALVLTNEPPAAPTFIEGDLDVELGNHLRLVRFGATDPNNDPLEYSVQGKLPEEAIFDPREGTVFLEWALFESFISSDNPYDFEISAREQAHGHAPELASPSSYSAQLRIVDTTPPESISRLIVSSGEPETLSVVCSVPEDNEGYGRVADMVIAVAPHEISDWDSADVQKIHVREYMGIDDPNEYLTAGDPYSVHFDLGLGSGRQHWYADAIAIDAAGLATQPLASDESTYVYSLGEYMVDWLNDPYKTLISLDNRPEGHLLGDTLTVEGKAFIRHNFGSEDPDGPDLAYLLNPTSHDEIRSFLDELTDGINSNLELDATATRPSVELNYNQPDKGYVVLFFTGPDGTAWTQGFRNRPWPVMDSLKALLIDALSHAIDDPQNRHLYREGVETWWGAPRQP